MPVRAKFRCVTKSVDPNGGGTMYNFSACIDPENKNWAKATPSGTLFLNVNQDNTDASFEQGKEYYLDISPCPDK